MSPQQVLTMRMRCRANSSQKRLGRHFALSTLARPSRPPLTLVTSGVTFCIFDNSRDCRINRYYDPTTDQFLSIDPKVAATDQPYVFTNDNPLNATDPIGQSPLSVLKSVVRVVVKAVVTARKDLDVAVCGQSPCPVVPALGAGINLGNFQKVGNSFLKNNDLNAHEIKGDVVGKNSGQYDIYRDPSDGQLFVGPKSGAAGANYEPTGIYVKNGNVTYGSPGESSGGETGVGEGDFGG